MDKLVASTRLPKDAPSKQLIEFILRKEDELHLSDGAVYYEFPLFRDESDILYKSNVLVASRRHGLLIFQTSDLTGRDTSVESIVDVDAVLAQTRSLIFSKLVRSKSLRDKQQSLKINVLSFVFAPNLSEQSLRTLETEALESPVLTSLIQVEQEIVRAEVSEIAIELYLEIRSLLEGAKGLIRPKKRDTSLVAGSRAAILASLESEIANFDSEQRLAAIPIVDGPQRIRGLAGSGKTVVLAMKAANIHVNDPEAQILVTFYTKSLYDFLKQLITRFYRQFHDSDPNWEKVHILHAWGGRRLGGVYFNACFDAGVSPLTFDQAKGHGADPFEYACNQLIVTERVKQKYSYVLMDEAQDFPLSFYRLCFQLAGGGEHDRRIIWAYDELQNILDVRVPSTTEAFGKDSSGEPLIDLDRAEAKTGLALPHNIVLYKCYRNPREVLFVAHALGFGIYSGDGMVQMLENEQHWQDVGYQIIEGQCQTGKTVVIERPIDTSPLSLSKQQTINQIIECYSAKSFSDEVEWIGRSVREFLSEGLRPDDILIIALDDRNARNYFTSIAQNLSGSDIRCNNVLTNPYDSPVFTVENEVTLSTVYRAKGNEAAVVFVIGIDALYGVRGNRKGRNKIFTAFTRARAWVRVSGLTPLANSFFKEIEQAKAAFPRFEFKYPDLKRIHTIQRQKQDKYKRALDAYDEFTKNLQELGFDPDEQMELILQHKEKK